MDKFLSLIQGVLESGDELELLGEGQIFQMDWRQGRESVRVSLRLQAEG